MNPDNKELQIIQRKFFQILDDFFYRATGSKYYNYCSVDEFSDAIRKTPRKQAQKAYEAFIWGYEELIKFYRQYDQKTFKLARKIGGIKLVLGGSSRFTLTHFDSVRKMLLYADTILIPDPILPWIEKERTEETFKHILLLENVFMLLHLKPLVDANLTCPAIVVFPSWEKTLEERDEATKTAITNLTALFFSHYLGERFESMQDTFEYVKKKEHDFLQKVDSKNLFIAPGQNLKNNILKNISAYKNEMKTWKSMEYLEAIKNMSDGQLVWLGINERLVPQFHLMENSEELLSQPMLCMDAHWHYYSLCAKINEDALGKINILEPKTISSIRCLGNERFEWLGNVPINALVDLRKDNANELFRKKLNDFTSSLYESEINNIDKVANEVSRGISSLLSEHKIEIRKIQEEYNRKHKKTLLTVCVTAAATFQPTLASLTGGIIPPLVLASKYAYDKIDELSKKKEASKSLMGVLAKATGK